MLSYDALEMEQLREADAVAAMEMEMLQEEEEMEEEEQPLAAAQAWPHCQKCRVAVQRVNAGCGAAPAAPAWHAGSLPHSQCGQ